MSIWLQKISEKFKISAEQEREILLERSILILYSNFDCDEHIPLRQHLKLANGRQRGGYHEQI